MWHILRPVSVAALMTASVGGCSAGADVEAADHEVRRFHMLLGAGDDIRIFRTAAPELTQAVPEQQFVALLRGVRGRLGKVRRTTQQGWHVNFTTAGRFTTVAYETEFERGRGLEQFVFVKRGEGLKLGGYHINSPDLLAQSLMPAEENRAANPSPNGQ